MKTKSALFPLPPSFSALCAAGLLIASAPLSEAQLLTDLEVHYTFDNGSFNTGAGGVIDSSGNNHNGTRAGTTNSTPGVIGESAYVNSGRVVATDTSVGNFGGGSFSISLWFNTSNINRTQTLVSTGRIDSGNAGWVFLAHGATSPTPVTRLSFATTTSVGSTATQFNFDTALTSNTWYHAALTYDTESALITAYINGDSIGSFAIGDPAAIFDTLAPFAVGANVSADGNTVNRAFLGSLDDLGLWSRVLTSQEIDQIYQQGLAGQAIPEPSGMVLLGVAGLAGAVLRHRRREVRHKI